jgi:endonuclease/exonuclease/phosphatase family metal-dependent hydrolase
MRALAVLCDGVLLAACATIAIGWWATDRWLWSQLLWWIPWPPLVAASIPSVLVAAAMRAERRAVLLRGGLVLVALAAWIVRDVGFVLPAPPVRGSLHVLHWNPGWPSSLGGAPGSRFLLDRSADVVVVSNPYKIFADQRAARWRAAGYDVVLLGTFAIASRWPVVEARTLFDAEQGAAATFRVDATDRFGGPLRILAVDLPSDPMLPRAEIAAAMRSRLDEIPLADVDLVVGDFNITRGSASIRTMFPTFRDAASEAAEGIAGTFPRWEGLPAWVALFLRWHIDQTLLAQSIEATRYRVLDAGSREHFVQEFWIVRRSTDGD